MVQARRLIETNPKNYEAYNALALALSRRARETSDVKFYADAEDTLKKAFEISPDNFDGRRIQVWLLLGRHEFAAAREEALKLNKRMPDDVMVYGFLTDANVELGNYDDAEKSAQLMLNLRPGNSPGVTRAAYLRELFGDVDGALELMNMALASISPSEVEDAGWISYADGASSTIGWKSSGRGKEPPASARAVPRLSLRPGKSGEGENRAEAL